jgi:hypothetical protein
MDFFLHCYNKKAQFFSDVTDAWVQSECSPPTDVFNVINSEPQFCTQVLTEVVGESPEPVVVV